MIKVAIFVKFKILCQKKIFTKKIMWYGKNCNFIIELPFYNTKSFFFFIAVIQDKFVILQDKTSTKASILW